MTMFIFLLVLVFRFSKLDCCGVSTHISIANQALQSFPDVKYYNVSYRNIILENLDAFYAGSTYPDAMYPSFCFDGRYSQVSEDTHWAPFLNASVNYIRNNFPKPWDKATRKLVSFLLGVVSHQVADISWHSLGIDQGFLQTMAKINFHGSYPTAHPVGDYGGDMVSMFEGDLHGVLPINEWYVPVFDLVNIYKQLYNKEIIDAAVIFSCSEVLYIEAVGESLAGADLFPTYARKSPFLVEELHSYFLGGKSDMAAWTSIIWAEAVYMIENGTTTCDIPKSTLHLRCLPKQSLVKRKYDKEDYKLQTRPRSSLMYVENVNRMDIINKKVLRGVYFATKGKTAEKLKREYTRNEVKKISDKGEILMKFFTKNKYAKLGWSLVAGQLPSFGEVVITGAPWYGIPGNSQHGRVYVLSANKNYSKIADVDEVADQILEGNNENSRFGFALAVLDFNQDGINDLAISAPSEGSNDLNYTGKVYIYYGNNNSGLSKNPDIIIEGDDHYYNLGTSLITGDVNRDGYKDLIISSKYAAMRGEQRGSVAVFFSSKQSNGKIPMHYFSNQSDWLLKGEQNYSWFGSSVIFHENTSIGSLLLVSAPTFRICAMKNCSYSQDDVQSVGKIYAYRWSNNDNSKLLFEITGQESLAKLGTSMAIGDPFGSGKSDVLAVSAPTAAVNGYLPFHVVSTTFDQAGQVFLFSLTSLSTKLTQDIEYITRFEGNRNYGRFGWHLSWQDVNEDGVDDLVFGSPFHTQDIDEMNGGEQGAVYIFYGGKYFPRGDATSNCELVKVEPCPDDKASLYFLSNQKYGQFGSNVIAMTRFSNRSGLIVSAPRQTSSLHNGAIIVIQLTNKLL